MARSFRAIVGAIAFAVALSGHAAVATTPLDQPDWAKLNVQQQRILAPLANEWDGMPSFRRKKWLGIAQRYPSMTPEQQQRLQIQMKPWASLTPEERNAARANYKKRKPETPEQREARQRKWQEYQALPEAEKKKLREKAARNELHKRTPPKSAPRPLTHPATPVVPPAAPSLSGTAAAK